VAGQHRHAVVEVAAGVDDRLPQRQRRALDVTGHPGRHQGADPGAEEADALDAAVVAQVGGGEAGVVDQRGEAHPAGVAVALAGPPVVEPLDDDAGSGEPAADAPLAVGVDGGVGEQGRADDEAGGGVPGRGHVPAPEQRFALAEEVDLLVTVGSRAEELFERWSLPIVRHDAHQTPSIPCRPHCR
jgi:hypothetical protein